MVNEGGPRASLGEEPGRTGLPPALYRPLSGRPIEGAMARILLVEDCPDARALVARALGPECELSSAETLEQGLRLLSARRFDLVLADLGLPDGDGFSICSRLRNDPELRPTPVVFLTASDDTDHKVTAFQLGAEDYIEKPFRAAELRARVEARLRKAEEREREEALVRVGRLRLDLARFRASVRGPEGDRPLELTPRELRILHVLAARPDRVVTRAHILEAVWSGVAVSARTVDTHVSNLRRKLGGSGVRIEGLRGVGYRLRLAPAGE